MKLAYSGFGNGQSHILDISYFDLKETVRSCRRRPEEITPSSSPLTL
jgi:hypothetical protein